MEYTALSQYGQFAPIRDDTLFETEQLNNFTHETTKVFCRIMEYICCYFLPNGFCYKMYIAIHFIDFFYKQKKTVISCYLQRWKQFRQFR